MFSMNSDEPLVSIIIPCYNQGCYLSDALHSAVNQTYKNIEIIVINDCSSDDTDRIARSFAKKHDIIKYFKNEKNLGCCETKNKAVGLAYGEYIMPLDADDKIESDYIEAVMTTMLSDDNIGVVGSYWDYFGEKTEIKCEPFNRNTEIFKNQIANSALFPKKIFQEVGGYSSYCYHGFEDWDLWLSIMEKGYDIVKLEKIYCHFRIHKKHRSDESNQYKFELMKKIFREHLPMYLNNDIFYKRIFTDGIMYKRKYKKLQRISNKMWPVIIILIIIIVIKSI